MNIETYREYCLSKPHTTESFPFDEDVLVFKVANKMFALTSFKKWEEGDTSVNLKCDPERAIELRGQYEQSIIPGYHMSKIHWNTVNITNGELSEDFIKELIDHSYDLVVKSLTKKLQRELGFIE